MRTLCFSLLGLTALLAQDPSCPRYPEPTRTAWDQGLARDRAFAATKGQALGDTRQAINLPQANFVDRILFAQWDAARLSPAPVSTDPEFLRRATLTLTGRIPSYDETTAFLRDTRSDKRTRLIEQLLASDAYVAQWTLWLGSRFRVNRSAFSQVGVMRRNAFHDYLRDVVRRDRSYAVLAREVLTASGDTDENPAAAYLLKLGTQPGPTQDFYDDLTDEVTTQFLGFRTSCISCHTGRGYLEKINLYLSRKRRSDFWNTAAFFARLQIVQQNDRDQNARRYYLQDATSGTYVGTVDPNNPGARPQRYNATVETPILLTTEAMPATGAWRQEFVRLVVEDRQFARAAVNYLWANFFGAGIVDPPDGWDLRRVDPKDPPPAGWPVQNTNPELMEALADYFIQNNYSLKAMIRLMANSTTWQLSSRYPAGQWKAEYGPYWLKYEPRRLTAEQLYDGVAIATQTESPLMVAGRDEPVYFANELPDPEEPLGDWRPQAILTNFGRGNWWDRPRDNSPNLFALLYSMNAWEVMSRTLSPIYAHNGLNRVGRLAASDISDEEAVRRLYLSTLNREPAADEMQICLGERSLTRRDEWLSRLQWALINKLDFIFNY